jgi:serine/threonine protein kinase
MLPSVTSEHKHEADVGKYKFGITLGKGSFGEVREATNVKTGKKVAIKIIPAAKADDIKLKQEIENQRRLHHKHVVEIVETFTKDGDTYIVMELVPGENLFEFIVRSVRIPELKARQLFQQIIAGLEHCHLNKVAHRDLKPENLFLDRALNVKIGDFGLSATMEEGTLLTDSCGSPNYAAPELLNKKCQYEGPEVDIWSCGVVLYALLCGYLPFDADSIPDLFRLIRRGHFVTPGHVSNEAKDLITQMLTVDQKQRISLSGIRKHPWFTKDLPADLFQNCTETLRKEEQNHVEALPMLEVVQSVLELAMVPTFSTACFAALCKSTDKGRSSISLAMAPSCDDVQREKSVGSTTGFSSRYDNFSIIRIFNSLWRAVK